MMPMLMGLDILWWRLESLEHEHRPEALRRPGYRYYDDFDDQEARTGRVQRVRSALFFSGVEAGSILAERLAGINLSAVLRILLDACKDVAVYWGGSVLAGGALGGAICAFGGGVGALPGAAIGAGLGSQVGAWVLGILGLKALLEDLGTALPEALRHYERGIRLAWGPVRHWESADSVFMDQDQASREIARGHVVLMMAVLSALSAYLTRGRGDPAARARLLQEIRESPRLGPKVAGWVAANEEALARHPGLKPKEQQVVMMSQAKPSAGPPMTPSQLKAARQAEQGMPAQKKSGIDNAEKVPEKVPVRPGDPGVVGPTRPSNMDALTAHPDGHAFSVHGGSVTDADLIVRARSGVKPDGSTGPIPPLSSAFYSDELLIATDQAIREGGGLARAIARQPGQSVVRVETQDVGNLGRSLGYGYARLGATGNKAANAAGVGPLQRIDGFVSAQGIYEFNPTTGVWETVTVYPAPR